MADLTYADGAHLLRRAGFGGPPAEIESLASLGRQGAVDRLIDYEQIDTGKMDRALKALLPLGRQGFLADYEQRWWFARMITTPRPFEEKMTLFWHNHFATSESKASFYTTMLYQILRLRQYALGRFDDLLLAVAQDPAMLTWLDGISNVAGRPNENFARELQELFTMGTIDAVTGEPNYSEQDVKEIARAFTGWGIADTGRLGFNPKKPGRYQFLIRDELHDSGSKTIYGRTANFSGEDVVGIIAARRSTARFLVKKLFTFFVYPLSDSAEDKSVIEKFADVYMSNDHSIRELVRAIFSSDEFFSDRARLALVKSPAELIAGALRILGVDYRDDGALLLQRPMYYASWAMGMTLFQPPDVSGWKLNIGWINTATLLARYNFANTLITNRTQSPPEYGPAVSNDTLKLYTKATAQDTVASFLNLLGPISVDSDTMDRLTRYLETDAGGGPSPFVNDDATIDRKIRGLVHQIMCLPQFQLN